MNVLFKKVLLDKACEVPLKNLITSLNTALGDNRKRQQDDPSVDKKEKLSYLNSKAIDFNQGWNTTSVSICKKTLNNIHIHPSSGDFFCLLCHKNGSWADFKNLADHNLNSKEPCLVNHVQEPESGIQVNEMPNFAAWNFSKPTKLLTKSEFKIILKNTGLNVAFEKSLFESYDIRFDSESRALFPVYDKDKRLIEIVNINSTAENENLSKTFVYGHEALTNEASKKKEIFITDRIINMLVLNQETNKPVIVINSVESVDFKTLCMLELYDKITIWQRDLKLAYNLARAFNYNRCFLISHARNPFECISLNESIEKIIAKERFSIKSDFVIRFTDLKSKIYSELVCPQEIAGVQWKRYPRLNSILKGHRSGELTIFTGQTGVGKTTFLSEYSLDLSAQGVTTLWGSFELQNHRLVKIMMSQYSKLNLSQNISIFEFIASKFAQLPLYFMAFHGEETLENVIRTMSNAVITHGVKHVIIDNLQFMIGLQFGFIDKFSQQDQIIAAFRRFATNFNVHVTIVIHPRKEDGTELLKVSSVFGSAKATQESDNILILQQYNGNKFIQVVKNRFDGELGNMMLKFNKENLTYDTKAAMSREFQPNNGGYQGEPNSSVMTRVKLTKDGEEPKI